jgi:hypothetical protein
MPSAGWGTMSSPACTAPGSKPQSFPSLFSSFHSNASGSGRLSYRGIAAREKVPRQFFDYTLGAYSRGQPGRSRGLRPRRLGTPPCDGPGYSLPDENTTVQGSHTGIRIQNSACTRQAYPRAGDAEAAGVSRKASPRRSIRINHVLFLRRLEQKQKGRAPTTPPAGLPTGKSHHL